MRWEMIFVLLCLLVVVPAHAFYGDYGGAKMPQYGDGFDDAGKDNDYKERALDPSSLLDNKFDDESFGKHNDRNNYHEEIMNKQKTRSKLKRPHSQTNFKQERYNPYELVTRNSKSQTKYHNIEYDDIYDIGTDRNRKINYKSQVDQGFEDDYSDVRHTEETSQRKRKARDRMMSTERNDYKSYTMQPKKRLSATKISKRKNKMRLKYADDEIYTTDSKHNDNINPKYVDDDIYTTDRRPTRRKQEKEYTEYQDYYDMKRVHNIKKKLPQLLRRTKEDVDTTTQFEVTRTFRILAQQQKYMETTTSYPFATENITDLSTATTSNPLTNITLTTITLEKTTSLKDLSMAEKSRLSIMMKVQKKEFAKVEETITPLVIMKVTQSDTNTVEMFAPSEKVLSTIPYYENIESDVEVLSDTPEMILKAKQLMRKKLIKSARSISDFIGNWDDTVCDFIDVSLLTSSSCSLSVSWWTVFYVILNYLMIV